MTHNARRTTRKDDDDDDEQKSGGRQWVLMLKVVRRSSPFRESVDASSADRRQNFLHFRAILISIRWFDHKIYLLTSFSSRVCYGSNEKLTTKQYLGVELVVGVRGTAHIVEPMTGSTRPATFPVLRDEEAKRTRRACAVRE